METFYDKRSLIKGELSNFESRLLPSKTITEMTCQRCGKSIVIEDKETDSVLLNLDQIPLKWIDKKVKCCENPFYLFSNKRATLKLRKYKHRREMIADAL